MVIRKLAPLRKSIAAWRAAGDSIALLPTMGALHEGHLRLARLAKKKCDRALVSIFVNPAQFGPHEDLKRYPRDLNADLALLSDIGIDAIWAPPLAQVYPDDFATTIVPAGAALELETQFRPQFFTGVATICTKLFTQVAPDIAIFGEKDYQQLQVIRQTVRDLDLPLKIVGAPTVRTRDGLALSSRNVYLSDEERLLAPMLYKEIKTVAGKVAAGGRIGSATAVAGKALTKAGFKVEYIDVRDAATLAPVKSVGKGTNPAPKRRAMRVLVAAWLGKTRLIDNCAVK